MAMAIMQGLRIQESCFLLSEGNQFCILSYSPFNLEMDSILSQAMRRL
jgi:hypothetical protein